jgi:phosphoribosylformimino-5-aminoimidazole carboxamide ribotide isomerase
MGDDSMLILPAIDLRGGQCVRLRQGDYTQETVFGADPTAMALRFARQGAPWLHIVDLDGAKQGHPVNAPAVRSILRSVTVPVQLGGGLRNEEHVAEVLGWGVARVVIGTRAVQDPDGFRRLCERFPGQVALGLDARNGRVAAEGWAEVSEVTALDLARQCAAWPLAAIVYTDISRDGMLEGVNLTAVEQMRQAIAVPLIASGGVTTLDDVRRLAALRVDGCIVGRALYEGRLDLASMLTAASG